MPSRGRKLRGHSSIAPVTNSESGDIEGGPVDARTTLRILRVPIRPEAEYFFFHGSESKRIAGAPRRALFSAPNGTVSAEAGRVRRCRLRRCCRSRRRIPPKPLPLPYIPAEGPEAVVGEDDFR